MIKVHWWDKEIPQSIEVFPQMPEKEVEPFIKTLIADNGCDLTIHTYNEIVLTVFRMLIATDEIDCKDVEFFWNDDVTVEVNEYGVTPQCPRDWCDVHGDLACEILRNQVKKRKENRKV
jgi:hypothetical protein